MNDENEKLFIFAKTKANHTIVNKDNIDKMVQTVIVILFLVFLSVKQIILKICVP